MSKLYHVEVFMPSTLRVPTYIGQHLTYSFHARNEAERDYIDFADLPRHVPADARLIEVEVLNGVPSKWLLRWKHDSYRDLVAAVMSDGFVKTVWVNDRTDSHRTLNRGRYATA